MRKPIKATLVNETTMRVEISGETREVDLRAKYREDLRRSAKPIGLYTRGGRQWPEYLYFWKQEDGSYHLALSTTIMNRQYPLCGWATEIQNPSQHNTAFRSEAR